MMRRVLLLAPWLAPLVIVADEPPAKSPAPQRAWGLQRGATVTVRTSRPGAVAPACYSEDAYRDLLKAVRSGSETAVLRVDWIAVRTGRTGKLIAVHDDPSYPLRVPAAEVKIGADPVAWIPVQYLRLPDDPAPPGEFAMPLFIAQVHRGGDIRIGDQFGLYNEESSEVLCAVDRESCLKHIAFQLAGNRQGTDDLLARKRLRRYSTANRAALIDRQTARVGGETVTVLHCHPVDEPPERTVWIWDVNAVKLVDKGVSGGDIKIYRARIDVFWKDRVGQPGRPSP